MYGTKLFMPFVHLDVNKHILYDILFQNGWGEATFINMIYRKATQTKVGHFIVFVEFREEFQKNRFSGDKKRFVRLYYNQHNYWQLYLDKSCKDLDINTPYICSKLRLGVKRKLNELFTRATNNEITSKQIVEKEPYGCKFYSKKAEEIMKKWNWNEAGLGVREQGRLLPVSCASYDNRRGIGFI
jgi:hypothetical protein